MGLWEDVKGVVSLGEILIRELMAVPLVLQPDAGVATPPSSAPPPSPLQYPLFVICAVFQKPIREQQRGTSKGEGHQLRTGLLVVSVVVLDVVLEVGDDVGEGLVVVLHLLVMRPALCGTTGPHEGCHAAEHPPESSSLPCGQSDPVVVDEQQVPQLLLLTPVTSLRKNT